MKSSVGFLLLLFFVQQTTAVLWDAGNYPNPTTQAGAKECGLRSAGQLCDPDGILTEQERYRLNHEITRLESRTYQEFGRDFCEKKGLTAVILLAKNVKGGTENDVRGMATNLRQRWNLDQQCAKGLVIFVSIEDRKFWVSRDQKVPVYADEFSKLLNAQQEEFRQKRYLQGLQNIVSGTADAAIAKQGQLPPAQPPAGGTDGGKGRVGPASGGSGGSGFPALKMPPLWVILVIVLVVIPLLLCCCCMYFCFCRGRTVGNRRQSAADDVEGGGAAAGGQQGGRVGDQIRGMLSGAGGGALMSMLQNCFSNRARREGPPHPDEPARGGYVPPRPIAEEGKGLYPATPVNDKGAGGSW